MCTFLFWTVSCVIWDKCIVGFVRLVYWFIISSSNGWWLFRYQTITWTNDDTLYVHPREEILTQFQSAWEKIIHCLKQSPTPASLTTLGAKEALHPACRFSVSSTIKVNRSHYLWGLANWSYHFVTKFGVVYWSIALWESCYKPSMSLCFCGWPGVIYRRQAISNLRLSATFELFGSISSVKLPICE